MRPVNEIEQELEFICRLDERNKEAVDNSDYSQAYKIFAASSEKRRRILERELVEAKSERAYELFGLTLHTPRYSHGTIPLRVLAKLSSVLNDAIEQAAWREWDVNGDAKNIDDGFRRLINLRLSAIESGSTKLVFLGNTAPDLTGDSALESGLRNLFAVFSADNENFPDVINGIGNNATKSVMNLMKTFEAENVGVEFFWRAADDSYSWDGKPDAITRIRALLEEFGEAETRVEQVQGKVCALTRTRVQIEDNDGNKRNARYHRRLSESVNALHLDQACTFSIEVTSYPMDTLGIKKDAYRLVDIESADAAGGVNIISST